MGSRRRAHAWTLLWGVTAAALYLAAGSYVWTRVPVRLLYEGEAPPLPYRWVRPPANLPEPNQLPESGTGTIPLTPNGSQSASVLTDDGQAAVIFRFGAIVPRAGVTSVQVSITPIDPATISPPPRGLRFDGNAYRMQATYRDGTPISLSQPVTVVLRYPRHATILLRSTGDGWSRLDAHIVEGALQIFASTDRLGVFVAAAPVTSPPIEWWGYVAGGAAALGVLVAVAARALERRRHQAGERARRRRRAEGHASKFVRVSQLTRGLQEVFRVQGRMAGAFMCVPVGQHGGDDPGEREHVAQVLCAERAPAP